MRPCAPPPECEEREPIEAMESTGRIMAPIPILPVCDENPACGGECVPVNNPSCPTQEQYCAAQCNAVAARPAPLSEDCDTFDCDCGFEMCVCPQIYNPVCGADGLTYNNSCEANCADVRWSQGSCDGPECEDTDCPLICPDGQVMDANGCPTCQCVGPDDEGSCQDNTDCEPGEQCVQMCIEPEAECQPDESDSAFTSGRLNENCGERVGCFGTCQPRDNDECPDLGAYCDAVCDGDPVPFIPSGCQTPACTCAAQNQCTASADCPGNQICEDGMCSENVWCIEATDCIDSRVCLDGTCQHPVCPTEAEFCAAECRNLAMDPLPTMRDECDTSMFDCECGPPAICVCIAQYDPVCGTNGQTYSNSCRAACENVQVDYVGQCNDNACACEEIYSPVCGTNGQTYDNRCEAGCDNVTVAYAGQCTEEGCDCPDEVNPVCGDDGQTYSNQCEASCQEVSSSPGACDEGIPDQSCVNDRQCGRGEQCITVCTDPPAWCVGFDQQRRIAPMGCEGPFGCIGTCQAVNTPQCPDLSGYCDALCNGDETPSIPQGCAIPSCAPCPDEEQLCSEIMCSVQCAGFIIGPACENCNCNERPQQFSP